MALRQARTPGSICFLAIVALSHNQVGSDVDLLLTYYVARIKRHRSECRLCRNESHRDRIALFGVRIDGINNLRII